MPASMTHYYFLKSVIEDVDPLIKMKLQYTEDELFFDATFNDLPLYYRQFNPFKKDKYQLYEKLHSDKFYFFFKEVIKVLKAKQGYDNLLLTYGMISHFILDKHLKEFFKDKTNTFLPYDLALKTVDQYYSLKNETVDLLNIKLTNRFKKGFTYPYYAYKLTHYPFLKAFNFFGKENYFAKCEKRQSFYYFHLANARYLKPALGFLDLFSYKKGSKMRKIAYVYPSTKKIKINLLNLDKKEYVVDDVKYTYSIDEVYNNARKETKTWIEALNKFMFFNQDKHIRTLLKLDKTEEL